MLQPAASGPPGPGPTRIAAGPRAASSSASTARALRTTTSAPCSSSAWTRLKVKESRLSRTRITPERSSRTRLEHVLAVDPGLVPLEVALVGHEAPQLVGADHGDVVPPTALPREAQAPGDEPDQAQVAARLEVDAGARRVREALEQRRVRLEQHPVDARVHRDGGVFLPGLPSPAAANDD